MTTWTRLALLTCLVMSTHAASVSADTINVAEFYWEFDADFNPGPECGDDPQCEPPDPIARSLLRLTGLWDYAAAEAPELTGFVTFADGSSTGWLPTPSAGDVNLDQFEFFGPLSSAATTIFFDFLGETRSLSALLTAPGFAVLSFDYQPPVAPPNPVPEPGTLGLLGIGLAVLARTLARRNRTPNSHAR